DPSRSLEAQRKLQTDFVALWTDALRRMTGSPPPPEPARETDKRYADPEWHTSPVHDFLRKAHSMTEAWARDLIARADGVDAHTRHKAEFYLRQIAAALSPANFVATNPELARRTLAEGGENLVRGMKMLAEDIEAGHGSVKIRQADSAKFDYGVNVATTPGKVVFRNDLIELIQYAPTTPAVRKRPLLIVPPWINKFYVLDLNPEKSFVRWAVASGLTVFAISWVNPDARHAGKDFASYMEEGVLAAIDAIEAATGEREVSAAGYCVGGTMLGVTLAYLAAKGERRIADTTFFATQLDFEEAGDLLVFVDEPQLALLEGAMARTGYLEGARMANAFNALRPGELIWSYVVSNYLKGEQPPAFDLLAWNSDSTRMPAANHSFYLRQCYLENRLSRGEMTIAGRRLDLSKVTAPVYSLATKEDHIAPARSVFAGAAKFGGPVRYVMSGSGHIAGVINPPAKAKYQYWTGGPVKGAFAGWLEGAKETAGSWWPDWRKWLDDNAPAMTKARIPGDGKLKTICDAPGEYVRVRC
ncbi:MAG: class I poly(R)-hydroxyalkanoic acid synthase, partial [Hyphomicrobiales bacterium]|nr:class I poly(R)-hydroxyalkanoic acid synthase [Hyphomicrobiales bacterium]